MAHWLIPETAHHPELGLDGSTSSDVTDASLGQQQQQQQQQFDSKQETCPTEHVSLIQRLCVKSPTASTDASLADSLNGSI